MKRADLTYDQEADCMYVRLSDDDVERSVEVDDLRHVDYSVDGGVVGVEFIGVSAGIELHGIPFERKVEEIIRANGFQNRILAT